MSIVFLKRGGLPITAVPKAYQPGHTTIDMIAAGEIDLIINTLLGQQARSDQNVVYGTTLSY